MQQSEPGYFTMNNNVTHPVTYPDVVNDPHYLELWPFEQGMKQAEWADWFEAHSWLVFVIVSAYVTFVLGMERAMKDRKPIGVRTALGCWDTALALFSFVALLRSTPELIHTLSQDNGLHLSICSRGYRHSGTVFWGLAFGMAKIAELGDTVFTVLRKGSLTFLHVYHHVTVLLYLWVTAPSGDSTLFWFGIINGAIHSVMYSYYALKAWGLRISRRVSLAITSVQLLQMVAGLVINTYVLIVKKGGGACETQLSSVYLSFALYASYFVLFAKFFYSAYCVRPKKSCDNITRKQEIPNEDVASKKLN